MNETGIPWGAIGAIAIALVFVVGYTLFCWSRTKLKKMDKPISGKEERDNDARIASEEMARLEQIKKSFDMRL